jgi:signal transduction histidine kinase
MVATAAVAGLVLGAVSERASGTDPEVWILDLVVGWSFIVCGAIAALRRPDSRAGLLMVATGAAWFVPNFSLPAWLEAAAVSLHRGVLVHLLVTFPTGRAGSRLARATVLLAYVAAVMGAWAEDLLAVPLAALLFLLAYLDYRRVRGPARRANRVGLQALCVALLVFAGAALTRIAAAGDAAPTAARWGVEVALCLGALWLLATLLTARWERAAVTDLVVEMGTAPSDQLRDQLAHALGDPGLEIGYWAPEREEWVDSRGRGFTLPNLGAARSVTRVEGSGGPIAALVHDPAVLDDPGLLSDIRAAAELAAANARLQADLRGQVVELEASRRRVLDAGDHERQRLEQQLRDGPLRRLNALAAVLAASRRGSPGRETAARLAPAEGELAETLADLTRLGRGLHPRDLTDLGLAGALRALIERSPCPVSMVVARDPGDLDPAVAAAAYYLCSEALANIDKHARAASATIKMTTSNGHLAVEVTDDGVGGADGTRGSGLRGLADRVETLGGSLTVTSPPGAGTRLRARIPLVPERSTRPG